MSSISKNNKPVEEFQQNIDYPPQSSPPEYNHSQSPHENKEINNSQNKSPHSKPIEYYRRPSSQSRSRSYRSNSHDKRDYHGYYNKPRRYPFKENSRSRDYYKSNYYSGRHNNSHIKYIKKSSRENSSENNGNCVYISNLNKILNEDDIKEKFSKFGPISDINIIKEPNNNESRGFGFITFENSKDAKAAVTEMNGYELKGKTINVDFSKRLKPRQPTPGVYLGPKNDFRRNNYYNRNFYYNNRHRRSFSRSHSRRSRSRSNYRMENRRRYSSNSRNRRRSGSFRRK